MGFEDPYVPKHITYAYKKSAKIIPNDEFYNLDGHDSEIDVLFVILNAPLARSLTPRKGPSDMWARRLAWSKPSRRCKSSFPVFSRQNRLIIPHYLRRSN